MANEPARQQAFDPRIIEIDTERVMKRRQHHFAVVDIGSNSIRLVVYDDLGPCAVPRFNEKSFVALGQGSTGRATSPRGVERAVTAVRQFDAIARAMEVEQVHVIATEATRRAGNGGDLIGWRSRPRPGSRSGCSPGREEATCRARVISAFPAKGLAGDFGGGSLEVAEILGDRVGERMVSMSLGALPAMTLMEQGIEVARPDRPHPAGEPAAAADRSHLLRDRRRLAGARARPYRQQQLPDHVVHGYSIPADEALAPAHR